MKGLGGLGVGGLRGGAERLRGSRVEEHSLGGIEGFRVQCLGFRALDEVAAD